MTLRDLATIISKQEYANIPQHAWPKKTFRDKTANDLTKAVLAFFKYRGIKAWRQANEGRYIQPEHVHNVIGHRITVKKGRFIPRGKASKGIGDIAAVINGIFTSWEVKVGKDTQRADQKTFQKDLEASGGKYFLIKTWDDFYFQFSQYETTNNSQPASAVHGGPKGDAAQNA